MSVIKRLISLFHFKKWIKVEEKELIEDYPDVLRKIWHYGAVEPFLTMIYKNQYTGKFKIRRK